MYKRLCVLAVTECDFVKLIKQSKKNSQQTKKLFKKNTHTQTNAKNRIKIKNINKNHFLLQFQQ